MFIEKGLVLFKVVVVVPHLCLLLFGLQNSEVDGKVMINHRASDISRMDLINYFRTTLQSRFSSYDSANEEAYQDENYAEDLYHNIDNLMPRQYFTKFMLRTKNITDKIDNKGNSLLNTYQNELNAKCHVDSIFNTTVAETLRDWDGDRTMASNAMEKWLAANADTPAFQLCNRFKGLTCQFKMMEFPEKDGGKVVLPTDNPTCQCSGDEHNVGFFSIKHTPMRQGESLASYRNQYPDGCYIRPWKPCRHLSLDYSFGTLYHEWHRSIENYRRQLAQMVFPVGRVHRCKRGTYCLDLIPGLKKPVCWCNPDSPDEACVRARSKEPLRHVPTGHELAQIRTKFMSLIINPKDQTLRCNPRLNPVVEKLINASGKDPTETFPVNIMKQLIALSAKTPVHICDFRESMYCTAQGKCKGMQKCGHGQIHLGKGVCAVDNAHPCVSNEDCVANAKCKLIADTTDSVCICERGYGSQCRLQNPPFFSKLFIPVISGFRGEEYVKLQVRINGILEAWEDAMSKDIGEKCDISPDPVSVQVVNIFGNLEKYDNVSGDKLLMQVKEAINGAPKMCLYTKFLRCHQELRKCVPLFGTNFIGKQETDLNTGARGTLHVEVKPEASCTKRNIPKIFHDMVVIHCAAGYACVKENNMKFCRADCSHPRAPRAQCPERRAIKSGLIDPVDDIMVEMEKDEMARGRSARFKILGRQDGVAPGQTALSTTTTSVPITVSSTASPTPIITSTSSPLPPEVTSTTTTAPDTITSTASTMQQTLKSTSPATVISTVTTPPPPSGAITASTETAATATTESSKGSIGQVCTFNPETGQDTCNKNAFLSCIKGVCACAPSLVYHSSKDMCMIPVGELCDKEDLELPKDIENIYDQLKCNYGVCMEEYNTKKVCRPNSDKLAIIINFNNKE